MLFLFSIILCAIIAFYLYAKKCNNYWKERGVTTVKSNFLLGTLYDFVLRRRTLEDIHDDIYRSKPDESYVGIYSGLKPVLFLRDPDLIHQITVNDFSHFHDRQKHHDGIGRLNYHLFILGGEEWKAVRNQLMPSFTASKLKRMYELIEDCAEMVVEEHFRPLAKAGQPVDVKETTERFSLDVIGKCAFGLRFNILHESESLYHQVGKLFNETSLSNTIRFLSFLGGPSLMRLLRMKVTPTKVENFFFNLLHGAEELRRREIKQRDDMFQLMLDLKQQDKLTDNYIASNMFAFYTAGHEPVSHAIVFALHELSGHLEIQEKLRLEIKKAREANNGVLDYTTLTKIEYLEMVVAETLRLHGTAPLNSRMCTKAYRIPGSSFEVQPGQTVVYLTSAIHKDEKYFPSPLKFDPERFSEENVPQMNERAYLPWGSGPRICVGKRFAKLEIKMFLAAILSHFKFSLCYKSEDPIILQKGAFFHSPQNEVWLTVEEIDR